MRAVMRQRPGLRGAASITRILQSPEDFVEAFVDDGAAAGGSKGGRGGSSGSSGGRRHGPSPASISTTISARDAAAILYAREHDIAEQVDCARQAEAAERFEVGCLPIPCGYPVARLFGSGQRFGRVVREVAGSASTACPLRALAPTAG